MGHPALPLDVEWCKAVVESKRWKKRITVLAETDCWVRNTKNKYTTITYKKKAGKAHRVAWVAHHSVDVPKNLVVDHLCRNRACVKPEHLEAITERENILRGEARAAGQARQTMCKNGHPLTGDNLVPSHPNRQCLACTHEANKANSAAVRAAARALGMTKRAYTKKYGYSYKTASEIIQTLPKEK